MVRSVGFCEFSFVNQHFMEYDILRSDIRIDRQDRNLWLQVSLDSRCVTYVFNPNIMTIWHNYWYNIDFTWALGGFANFFPYFQTKNTFCTTNSLIQLPPFQVGQFTPLFKLERPPDRGGRGVGQAEVETTSLDRGSSRRRRFFLWGGRGGQKHIYIYSTLWSSGVVENFISFGRSFKSYIIWSRCFLHKGPIQREWCFNYYNVTCFFRNEEL